MGDFFNFLFLCLQNAFSLAWNSVNIVSTIVELGVSAVIVRLPKHEDTALKYGARAVLWTFGIIFAGRLLLSPYFVYENLKMKYTAVPGPSPTTINVNEADPEVRKDLAETKRELEDTKKKLVEAQKFILDQDPLNEPIASASATITIDAATDHRPSANMGCGGWIALCTGSSICLLADTLNNSCIAKGSGHSGIRLVEGICSADDAYMGKPIRSLLDCRHIEVVFNPDIISENIVVEGGEIVWVINNRVTLKFDVPPQKTFKQPAGTCIIVPDLNTGLRPLIAPSIPRIN